MRYTLMENQKRLFVNLNEQMAKMGFEIIDGQNQFTALKELKLPIHFTIVCSQSGGKAAFAMNKAQSRWRVCDYIDSRAKNGNPDYINLRNLLDDPKYKQIPFGTKLVAVTKYYSNSSNGLALKVIKNGILEFPQGRITCVRQNLDQLLKVIEVYNKKGLSGKKDLFLNAVMFLSNIEGLNNRFEFDVFLENFIHYNDVIGDCSSFENCLKHVVKIHNIEGKNRYQLAPTLKLLEEKSMADKKWVKNRLIIEKSRLF